MDCSFLESMQINWNKVQIRTNSQKEQELKMPQKWQNFENLEEKKISKFMSVLSLCHYGNWPGNRTTYRKVASTNMRY